MSKAKTATVKVVKPATGVRAEIAEKQRQVVALRKEIKILQAERTVEISAAKVVRAESAAKRTAEKAERAATLEAKRKERVIALELKLKAAKARLEPTKAGFKAKGAAV